MRSKRLIIIIIIIHDKEYINRLPLWKRSMCVNKTQNSVLIRVFVNYVWMISTSCASFATLSSYRFSVLEIYAFSFNNKNKCVWCFFFFVAILCKKSFMTRIIVCKCWQRAKKTGCLEAWAIYFFGKNGKMWMKAWNCLQPQLLYQAAYFHILAVYFKT